MICYFTVLYYATNGPIFWTDQYHFFSVTSVCTWDFGLLPTGQDEPEDLGFDNRGMYHDEIGHVEHISLGKEGTVFLLNLFSMLRKTEIVCVSTRGLTIFFNAKTSF